MKISQKIGLLLAFAVIALSQQGLSGSEIKKVIATSRDATVSVTTDRMAGTGFFIGSNHIVTCFHVVGTLQPTNGGATLELYSNLHIKTVTGETLEATVVSIPTTNDLSPFICDFAVLQIKTTPTNHFDILRMATTKNAIEVGDDIIFSGFPLDAKDRVNMITAKGMISGFGGNQDLISIQSSVNQGNSGGAVLSLSGNVIGIIDMREGGVSVELDKAMQMLGSSRGTHMIMNGVDTGAATATLIQTLQKYISTGIGYAASIKFLRSYAESHPEILK